MDVDARAVGERIGQRRQRGPPRRREARPDRRVQRGVGSQSVDIREPERAVPPGLELRLGLDQPRLDPGGDGDRVELPVQPLPHEGHRHGVVEDTRAADDARQARVVGRHEIDPDAALPSWRHRVAARAVVERPRLVRRGRRRVIGVELEGRRHARHRRGRGRELAEIHQRPTLNDVAGRRECGLRQRRVGVVDRELENGGIRHRIAEDDCRALDVAQRSAVAILLADQDLHVGGQREHGPNRRRRVREIGAQALRRSLAFDAYALQGAIRTRVERVLRLEHTLILIVALHERIPRPPLVRQQPREDKERVRALDAVDGLRQPQEHPVAERDRARRGVGVENDVRVDHLQCVATALEGEDYQHHHARS